MIIYEKHFDDSSFNYIKIVLLYPILCFNKISRDDLCLEEQKTSQLRLETIIEYVSHRIFRSFKIRVLGFGFEIIRQTSY